MRFELPNAVAAMNNAVAAVGDDGGAEEVVGSPLDGAVEALPEYDAALDLGLVPAPADKRREVGGLHWGRIAKDAARLDGLAAAIENIAGVIRAGRDQLAHDWKGEAYDAFHTAIDRVDKTLTDHATAVRTTADGLRTALTAIQTGYTTYRDDTVGTHLNFEALTPPADWWRMSHDSGEFLAENCTSHHLANCCYNDDEQLGIINERLVTKALFDRLQSRDCTDDAGVVIDQYRTTVSDAEEEQGLIAGKINNWYRATDQLRENVDSLLKEALDNLRILAEVKPFASLSVPAAAPPTGDVEISEPASEPAAAPVAAPVADAPAASEPEEHEPESVEIKDADRTITVSSPHGEGHVRVTVEDAAGTTTTYDLDFNAASGTTTPESRDPDAEHVPAGTNGKCVIQDGQVTITAERSLFDEAALTVTIDSGTAEPTTHTVDLAAIEQPPPADARTPEGTTATGDGVSQPAPVGTTVPAAETGTLTGVLVPEQSDGEAGLSSAGRGEPSGAAGAAVPLMAGAAGSGSGSTGRAGTGWSVHGDLFDSGDPVYSMHGVLGEDDLKSQ